MEKVTTAQFEKLKQAVINSDDMCSCPVWPDFTAKVIQIENGDGVQLHYWSPRAGGFFIADVNSGFSSLSNQSRRRVSSWTWERNAYFETEPEGELPVITKVLLEEIAKRLSLSTEQRIDRGLRAIGKPPRDLYWEDTTRRLGADDCRHEKLFQAATESSSKVNELKWLLLELEAAELVSNVNRPEETDGSGLRRTPAYSLTLKGLNRLETGGEALTSNTGFVAMWFDPKVGDAYEKGIKPAIMEAGYEPMRIDRIPHSGKIDDRIIAEIRRARFMVCDLTSGLVSDSSAVTGETEVARGSVYYEAGFAQGLGKPVIWTCRKDFLDQNRIHFDVRQYACIPWEEDKEKDLQVALYERIRAEIT